MRPAISRGLVVLFPVVLGIVALCTSAARADLYIQGYQPQLNDRLYSGLDKAFIGQSQDWSGVGKAGDRWVTMISSQYFVSVANKAPSGSVTFYANNTAASAHTYQIDSSFSFSPTYLGLDTNILLGRLTAPIDPADNIHSYPILQYTNNGTVDDNAYIGLPIYMYGQSSRVGTNSVDRVLRQDMFADTPSTEADFNVGVGDEAYVMSGDAGAPTFGVYNGELALLGVHMYNYGTVDGAPVDGYASGDAFLPAFVSQLAGQMNGQTLYVVPEPMTIALLAAGGLLMLRRRKAA